MLLLRAAWTPRRLAAAQLNSVCQPSATRGLSSPAGPVHWLKNALTKALRLPQEATIPGPTTAAEGSMNEIREGKAKVLLADKNDVFYNKAQVVNRDISIAVIKTFAKKRQEELENNAKHMRTRAAKGKGRKGKGKGRKSDGVKVAPGLDILEAMAASGLRALRYALEIPEINKVYANDIDQKAVDAMRKNIEHNGVEGKVEPTKADARILMLENPDTYDVIDLDPYGAPVTLLDGAVQAICDGGLLCVTATDMAVLCGNSSEACWMKYGSYPLKGKHCHEGALRIMLHTLQSHAARYKKYIVPVLSLSVDFYVRVFVRVFTSASLTKEAATRVSYAYQCNGCHAFSFQPVGRKETNKRGGVKFSPGLGPVVGTACEHCGSRMKMGGPFWTEPIHDKQWVKEMLGMIKKGGKEEFAIFDKVRGLITVIDEELPDVPLSLCMHDVTKVLKCTPPPSADVRSAIANAGYRVSSTHDNPTGIKTDAPFEVFWDIMRTWVRDHPNPNKLSEGTPGGNILAKPLKVEAKFSRVYSALSKAKMSKTPRFTPNPEAFWGPGTRASAGKRKRFMSAPTEGLDKNNKKDRRLGAVSEAEAKGAENGDDAKPEN
ncbi:N2,N2-dimethylguanosine tRNA methyltransferase [Chloropicon primus]|uniref:tRNA (guanine(26)-N(2))-dimethyltransferase n=1 Tax=Chloropicon primus TaxID=1764295 RepID=A0A5B8MIB8_9CHLO|nr:N2,N2-dimethylguanosine tRNA methyltransferase [Chloropicon primus]UPQ99341.1 N2,N2-dimethylguanosine tRNA methyltransferase [Chloropicon primus]|eukprot:QDZ20129.1 N2,N2-dimethylguanosine tRNA methyltransferase [Chloropicon primus]